MECTELSSPHGGTPKLLVSGHVYRLGTNSKQQYFWVCDRLASCMARLTTAKSTGPGAEHVVVHVGSAAHTHASTVDPIAAAGDADTDNDHTIDPEFVQVKIESDTGGERSYDFACNSAAPLELDQSIDCAIVLRPRHERTATVTSDAPTAQQLCVAQTRMYNMRDSSHTEHVYRWECINRRQLRCGSQLRTCYDGGRHVAIRDTFLEHSGECDRQHEPPKPKPAHIEEWTPNGNDEVAKAETIECDDGVTCTLAVPDGREELTVDGYAYQLHSMNSALYEWRCKRSGGADGCCAGAVATTIVAGRHAVLLNSRRNHTDCKKATTDNGAAASASASDTKNGRDIARCSPKRDRSSDDEQNEDDGHFMDNDSDESYCPTSQVKVEHATTDSPTAAADAAAKSEENNDDDRDEDYAQENDSDSDDEDYKPIAQLMRQRAAASQRGGRGGARAGRGRKSAAGTGPAYAGRTTSRLHGPNEIVPCFTLPTAQGNDKLCVEGYIYHKERQQCGNRCYWACAKRKSIQCCGRLVTVLENGEHTVQSVTIRQHNHEASGTYTGSSSANAQLRNLALGSRYDAAAIVQAVLANTAESARAELPDADSLVERVERIRADAGIVLDAADADAAATGKTAGAAGSAEAAVAATRVPCRRQTSRYMELDPNEPLVCSTVPSRRGHEKLCVLGYVYHLERRTTNRSFHWACERRKRYDPPCMARVVTHLDASEHHVIDRRLGVRMHNHSSPPDDGAAARRPSRKPYNADELREAESKRLERQLESNVVIPCTTIPTARGNETLFVQGHTYHCDRRTELFVYWKCVLSKVPGNRCPGRVTTTLQGEQHVVLSATLREHTHPTADADQERYRACAQLRQLAQETKLDADSIIAMVLDDCSEECRQKMGSISVLKKKVVRARKGEDIASREWRDEMRSPLEKERWAAVLRLKDMARKTTMDPRSIVAAVLADCSPECRVKLGNVVELRKKVPRCRLAQTKREAKKRKKLLAAQLKASGGVMAAVEVAAGAEVDAVKVEDVVTNKIEVVESAPEAVDGMCNTSVPFAMDMMLNNFQ